MHIAANKEICGDNSTCRCINFIGIPEVYGGAHDIVVLYTVGENVHTKLKDWIGLFLRGWSRVEDSVMRVGAQRAVKRNRRRDKPQRFVTFQYQTLKDIIRNNAKYQFVYVSSDNVVLGVSRNVRFLCGINLGTEISQTVDNTNCDSIYTVDAPNNVSKKGLKQLRKKWRKKKDHFLNGIEDDLLNLPHEITQIIKNTSVVKTDDTKFKCSEGSKYIDTKARTPDINPSNKTQTIEKLELKKISRTKNVSEPPPFWENDMKQMLSLDIKNDGSIKESDNSGDSGDWILQLSKHDARQKSLKRRQETFTKVKQEMHERNQEYLKNKIMELKLLINAKDKEIVRLANDITTSQMYISSLRQESNLVQHNLYHIIHQLRLKLESSSNFCDKQEEQFLVENDKDAPFASCGSRGCSLQLEITTSSNIKSERRHGRLNWGAADKIDTHTLPTYSNLLKKPTNQLRNGDVRSSRILAALPHSEFTFERHPDIKGLNGIRETNESKAPVVPRSLLELAASDPSITNMFSNTIEMLWYFVAEAMGHVTSLWNSS